MRRLRLRTLLTVLVLVTTLPIAAYAIWLIAQSSAQQRQLIDRQNVEQARAISVAVDQEIESTTTSLSVLALLDPIDAADKDHFIQIAARMLPLNPGWESLRLIDTDLHVLASTSGPAAEAPLLDPTFVKAAMASGKPTMSTVVQDPASARWMVSVAVPVVRRERLKYVLAARLYARMFNDVLQRQRLPRDGVVTLLDTAPRILARTLNQDKYVGAAPSAEFVERSRRQPQGSWRSTMLEGTPAYSAWSRSDLTGWTIGIGLPAEPVDAPVRRSFIGLIGAGFGVTAVGIGLALLLGSRMIRTQAATAAAARALARGEPVLAFDSNIAEAHEVSEVLREAAGILDTRLRERDEAQAEADRTRAALLERETSARRAAEALNRSKDEFIATVSHELRTPLNAIFGWVALLRTGSLTPAKQTHALEVIDRNTRAQAKLIEDLLDTSRVVRGTVRLGMEPLDFAIALDTAIDSLRPTAEARRIAVDADVPQGAVLVSGDQERVQQILWNVLSNALKFTPPGGWIRATLRVEGGEAVVRISDSGEGIAPEFLPHVFDRFRQENADVTRTHSGLGLGLSLVRHLVELHGGTISVESGGKARGSMFTIRLPVLQAAAATASVAGMTNTPLSGSALRHRRVLVVDDQVDARELCAEALGRAGAEVVTAATAAEALHAIDGRMPDAVIADIGMPGVSGHELAQRLRANPRAVRLPLIAVTAYGAGEDRDAALAAGFDAYIRKPYDPGALVAVVADLISSAPPAH